MSQCNPNQPTADGEKEVAVTTQTNDIYVDCGNWSRPPPITRAMPTMWFGHVVPEGVMHITLMRDYMSDELLVRWRVKGDDEIHQMPFEQSDSAVQAALVAMKLTC